MECKECQAIKKLLIELIGETIIYLNKEGCPYEYSEKLNDLLYEFDINLEDTKAWKRREDNSDD
ncbi:hypothetical protein LJC10_00630 [Selenomonadales bacterium OttesenSCG-928-I06]|nr:hypothetical protein [Selenomonadales bacterium OttesenSCG-928-I06]